MSYANLLTRASVGVAAPEVMVEVHLSPGLPAFNLVGLPATAVKESKERVRSAILNSGFQFPQQRVTVNLAPADLPKEGGRYDLPIAVGILCATGQIPSQILQTTEFIGELSLSGELRSVFGVLPVALSCQKARHNLCLPKVNEAEAAFVSGSKLFPCINLAEVCSICIENKQATQGVLEAQSIIEWEIDMCDVKGQYTAKRALEIAAAGRHHMLMCGPPGTGKTMLAMRLPTILPPLSEEQAVAVSTIESVANIAFSTSRLKKVRFRNPHHSVSAAALIGGGIRIRPGEISLAHNGVLFLDELAEFKVDVLEQLREPLESGAVHIARANAAVTYPARFQLIAALNPKNTGQYANDSNYFLGTKISKPLLDRIDIQINVPHLPQAELLQKESNQESSANIKSRVTKSRERQLKRGFLNADASPTAIEKICQLNEQAKILLQTAIKKFNLSPRAYHKTLKVARTIADLAAEENVNSSHIAEAMNYRLS